MRKNTTLLFTFFIAFFLISISNNKVLACQECGITSVGTIAGPSSVCKGDTAVFTFSGTNCLKSGCVLERITYVYSGSTLIYQSSVNTTSSQEIILQTPGTYSVYAKVRAQGYSYWCKTNTLCFKVNALPDKPTSSCTTLSKCANQSFTLSATPACSSVVKWYKGSTYLGSGNSITLSESTAGTHTYSAYSYNSYTGCTSSSSLSFTVTVIASPSNLVINAPSTAYVGEAISISGSASGTGNTFNWTFGSNSSPSTGTGAGPFNVTYSAVGKKEVKMTVSNGTCSASIMEEITVCPKAIISGPETACENVSISYSATDMGSSAIYNWSFGNGATPATATGKGPHSVSYSTGGTKTVSLTVTDCNLKSCTSTATKTVNINNISNPVINSENSVAKGDTLYVSGSASGSNLTYSWNFGANATPATATGAGPHKVVYSATGTKAIKMLVSSGTGCSTSVTKNIVVCPKAIINGPSSACKNTSMSFVATDMGSGTIYTWNFGSGATPATATGIGPHNVSYSTTGTKTVSLNVGNCNFTSCSNTATKTIQINGVENISIIANSTVLLGDTLYVSGTASGSNLTYSWNFGSGANPQTATGAGPIKVVYSSIGDKTISLTVSSGGSCSSSKTKVIKVCDGFKINSKNTECVNKSFSISASTLSGNSCQTCSNLTWNFGSGAVPQTATGLGPHSVKYTTTGTKTITFNSGSCFSGCGNTFTKNVVITDGECAEINIPPFKIFMDTALTYTATNIQGATYTWSATGNAVIVGSGNSVTILFPTAGSQTITLVTTVNGCTCTTTKAITVYEPVCTGVDFDYTSVPLYTDMKNFYYVDETGNTVQLRKPTNSSDYFKTSKVFSRNGDTVIKWSEKTSLVGNLTVKFNRSASDLTFSVRDLDKPQNYNHEMIEIRAYYQGDLIQSSKIEADFNTSNITLISDDGFVKKYKGMVASANNSSNNDISFSFTSKVDSFKISLSNTNGYNCNYKSDIGISPMCFCITEPLPVTWLKVKAVKNSNGGVNINWATASEINNDYFTIEKSTNRLDFEILGTVDGSGNTSTISNYTFEDKQVGNSTVYYRIKQTDYDGKFDYSIVVAVTPDNVIDNVKVNPNPASNWATIDWSSGIRNDITIQVTNLVGIEVYSQKVPADLKSYIMDLEKIQNGFYVVNIIHNNAIISKSKLVVKK
ncbi:MAG: T9SS type A sorting domain-containing protein [Bacteroidetes bacterium]|nr:T9SS type A sorting domain-containing protein [Bacteroidota bacterium]